MFTLAHLVCQQSPLTFRNVEEKIIRKSRIGILSAFTYKWKYLVGHRDVNLMKTNLRLLKDVLLVVFTMLKCIATCKVGDLAFWEEKKVLR